MMLYCRLLGAVLLVCTGFAAGQAYCQRLWAQWRAVCGFERLLTYLADQLAFCALPSAELLAAAAEHPAFAAYCPPSAASFAELRLPPPLAKTCGAELHAGLHTIALCSRQQAPQTMRTLAALCHRTAQGQYAAAQQAAVLAPKLGLCGGLLAAILLARGVKQGITEKAKARPAFYRGTIMNIDLVFKIAATGIIVAVLNQLLTRSGREDQAMMTTLAGLIVVLSMLVRQISDLFVLIKALFDL